MESSSSECHRSTCKVSHHPLSLQLGPELSFEVRATKTLLNPDGSVYMKSEESKEEKEDDLILSDISDDE